MIKLKRSLTNNKMNKKMHSQSRLARVYRINRSFCPSYTTLQANLNRKLVKATIIRKDETVGYELEGMDGSYLGTAHVKDMKTS